MLGGRVVPGRKEQRVESKLAIALDGGTGISRNVSASGIYFETEVPLREGASVSFSVAFTNPEGQPVRMFCAGWVVRTERLEGKTGVGARIDEFHIERVQEAHA